MTGKRRSASTSSAQDAKPDWDLSLLRQPMELGVAPGAMQVVKGIQSGNREIRELLLYECDIIYECRVCRNLFRGLANLVAHKRVYCTATYQEARMQMMDTILEQVESDVHVVKPKSADEEHSEEHMEDDPCGDEEVKNLTANDGQKGDGMDCVKNSPTTSDCQVKPKTLSAFTFYSKVAEMVQKEKDSPPNMSVKLEPVPGTKYAVFQSVCMDASKDHRQNGSMDSGSHKCKPEKAKSPPTPVKTRSSACTDPPVAVVEPKEAKGHLRMNLRQRTSTAIPTPTMIKLSKNVDCDVKSLSCLRCKIKFSSLKTLHFHMKSQHSEKRTFYPCIYCCKSFLYLTGAVRHVEKTHKKVKEELRKIRNTIRKRAFTQEVESGCSVLEYTNSNNMFDEREKTKGLSKGNGKPAGRLQRKRSGSKAYSLSADFTILKCKNCGSVFPKQESLDRHSTFCIEVKVQGKGDEGSSSNSSHSTSKSKRVIKVKTPEADFETSANVPLPRRLTNTVERPTVSYESEDDDELDRTWGTHLGEENLKKLNKIIDKKNLICLNCNRSYMSVSNLHRHAVRHLGLRRFKCKLCKFTAYNRSDCNTHLKRVHPEQFRHLEAWEQRAFVLELEPEKEYEVQCSSPNSLPHPQLKRRIGRKSSNPAHNLDRRQPGISQTNIQTCQTSIFNISTRKNPRHFDTSPYRPIDQMSILTTRSGFYIKPKKSRKRNYEGPDDDDDDDDEDDDEEAIDEGEDFNQDDLEEIVYTMEDVDSGMSRDGDDVLSGSWKQEPTRFVVETAGVTRTVETLSDGSQSISITTAEDCHATPHHIKEEFQAAEGIESEEMMDSDVYVYNSSSQPDIVKTEVMVADPCGQRSDSPDNGEVVCVKRELSGYVGVEPDVSPGQSDDIHTEDIDDNLPESQSTLLMSYSVSENNLGTSLEECSGEMDPIPMLIKSNQSGADIRSEEAAANQDVPHPVLMSDASGKVIMVTSFDNSADSTSSKPTTEEGDVTAEDVSQNSETLETSDTCDIKIVSSRSLNTTEDGDTRATLETNDKLGATETSLLGTVDIKASDTSFETVERSDSVESPDNNQGPFPCELHQNISATFKTNDSLCGSGSSHEEGVLQEAQADVFTTGSGLDIARDVQASDVDSPEHAERISLPKPEDDTFMDKCVEQNEIVMVMEKQENEPQGHVPTDDSIMETTLSDSPAEIQLCNEQSIYILESNQVDMQEAEHSEELQQSNLADVLPSQDSLPLDHESEATNQDTDTCSMDVDPVDSQTSCAGTSETDPERDLEDCPPIDPMQFINPVST